MADDAKTNKNKSKQLRSILIVVLFVALVTAAVWYYETYYTAPVSQAQEAQEAKEDAPVFNILSLIGSGVEIPAQVGSDQIVSHTGYTLSYNEDDEVADWVAYEFTNDELNAQLVQRTNNFREDEAIATESAKLADYKNSGYSRGHLAPAADFKWSEEAMADTFLLSNMTPQKQNNFNAGIWLKAENFVRELCSRNKVVFVVTGPVLTDGPYETIGESNVVIPKNFYKVLLALADDGTWSVWAMVIPQDAQASDDISLYMCTIDQVEDLTGLDFFPQLPDDLEILIESSQPGTNSR